jgi:L,D-transpeptidase catalytic domain
MKNKIYLVLGILLAMVLATSNATAYNKNFVAYNDVTEKNIATEKFISGTALMYEAMHLNNYGLEMEAFQYAVTGYNYLRSKKMLANSNILSIVDFTKTSTKKRLYVLDMKNKKVLYHTLVAHGQASGQDMATNFSNVPESLQSSLGFYKTATTYDGKNGFSLVLKGLENGINDNAEQRAIVMHGAPYVSQEYINETGSLGRSWGCPAVSEKLAKPIISKIKGGSCLFVYSGNKKYLKTSKFLKSF